MKQDLISIDSEIKNLSGSSVSGILSSQDHIRISELRSKMQHLMDHELRSALLQSRMTWENSGDANTKYFHAVASTHRNQNTIWGLEDDMGNLIEDDKGLKDLGVKYFSKNFRDDNQTNIVAQLKVIRLFASFILPKETERLSLQITLEEFEHALRSFKRDKSPGPDGCPVEFFLAFFDILGNDLLEEVEYSRLDGRVLPSMNSTFISLIPKKENPLTFADFRPISLCNLVYELIAKIASLLLKPFLDKFISSQQFGFLKNR